MNENYTPLENYYPERFDLVTIIDSEGKTQQAWWNGIEWDAYRWRTGTPVGWKRYSEFRELD